MVKLTIGHFDQSKHPRTLGKNDTNQNKQVQINFSKMTFLSSWIGGGGGGGVVKFFFFVKF
jgi:hypothetical protein